MGEDQATGSTRDGPGDGEWLTVAAAARRLGVSPRAIRGRIKRRTIEWRPAGNAGKAVFVPSGDGSRDDPGDAIEDEVDRLHAELGVLRDQLLESRVGQARAEERATALRELVDTLKADLAEARRPWWRRWLAG